MPAGFGPIFNFGGWLVRGSGVWLLAAKVLNLIAHVANRKLLSRFVHLQEAVVAIQHTVWCRRCSVDAEADDDDDDDEHKAACGPAVFDGLRYLTQRPSKLSLLRSSPHPTHGLNHRHHRQSTLPAVTITSRTPQPSTHL